MKERTPEMETAALLRRLKRLGVREVEWVQVDDGIVLRARVQSGRAHAALETRPHDEQQAALEELAALAADATTTRPGKRRRKATARPLHRPGAGEPTGPIDDVPMGEQPDRMADLPPFRHAREQAERAARAERVKARHEPDRAKQLPPARAPQERPGRGGGR